MQTKSEKSVFVDWGAWGLPAFASALAPWQEKLSKASLIPEFYQPQMNLAASVIAPLVCFAAFYLLKKVGVGKLKRFTKVSVAAFLILVLVCIALIQSLDTIWFPGPATQVLIRIFWCAAYLSIFISFGTGMVGAMLLAQK